MSMFEQKIIGPQIIIEKGYVLAMKWRFKLPKFLSLSYPK